MWLTLLLGALVLLIIWDHMNKKRRKEILLKSNISGSSGLPVLGNILQFRNVNDENILNEMQERFLVNATDKISYSWALHMLIVISANIKDVESLLSHQTHITKNNVYDMLRAWLGDGLLMSTNQKWHSRRKIITPTFHFKILEQFVDIYDQQSGALMKKLEEFADGETVVNMFPHIGLMALDVIAETAMGVKINAQQNPRVGYVKAVHTVTGLIGQRLRHALWLVDWIFRLIAPTEFNSLQEGISQTQAFTKDVIQKRRELLQSTLGQPDTQKNEDDDIGRKKRMALLDVLLQASVDGQPLSDEDIREEVETFMFAGHDTTTTASSFTLYLISRHPEVQKKLFDEIREVMGDDKYKPINYRDLQDLKYMECVIKEAMRLFPPVPIIGRYFAEDVEINKRVIPGNTHFNIPIFIILRDPDNFENPNEFKPERFMEDNQNKISPYAYIPFSAGPRNCIGQKFAILELKSVISKMLRHFELLPLGAEVIPTLSLVLRSINGINMGLKPRIYN